jgi:hypothetical protein
MGSAKNNTAECCSCSLGRSGLMPSRLRHYPFTLFFLFVRPSFLRRCSKDIKHPSLNIDTKLLYTRNDLRFRLMRLPLNHTSVARSGPTVAVRWFARRLPRSSRAIGFRIPECAVIAFCDLFCTRKVPLEAHNGLTIPPVRPQCRQHSHSSLLPVLDFSIS